MSNFWSGWIMALVFINYAAILLLFLWAPRAKIPVQEDGTTGHSWAHGTIREGLNNLPMWWLVLSTAAFVAAFIYLVRYPGFGTYEGTLNWTSEQQVLEEVSVTEAKMKPIWVRVEDTSVLELGSDEQAMRLAKRMFDDNCAACHGYDAKGVEAVGAPNLVNNSWQYGGSVAEITHTITEGRHGVMPSHIGKTIGYGHTKNVAHYVLGLSSASHDVSSAAAGKAVFQQQCAVCHGADGKGNKLLGAPDFTDGVWKFGGTWEDIVTAIDQGREGVMPAWKHRLNSNEIKLLAAWVLSHDNTDAALAAGDK